VTLPPSTDGSYTAADKGDLAAVYRRQLHRR